MKNSNKIEMSVIENEIVIFAPTSLTGRGLKAYLEATRKERKRIKETLPKKATKKAIEKKLHLKVKKGRTRSKSYRQPSILEALRYPVVKNVSLLHITVIAEKDISGYYNYDNMLYIHQVDKQRSLAFNVVKNIATGEIIIPPNFNDIQFRSYRKISTHHYDNLTHPVKKQKYTRISKEEFESKFFQAIKIICSEYPVKIEDLNSVKQW